jgi:hypothetical protein
MKTLHGQEIPIDVERKDTILEVKERVEKTTGIPVEKQAMLFQGKSLENENNLPDYGIRKEGSIMHLVIRNR